MNTHDLTGQKFGRLTAIRCAGVKSQKRMWLCECSCGRSVVVRANSLKTGNTTSCGCYMREVSSMNGKAHTTHGLSNDPVFSSWNNMLERCYNPKHEHFQHYGGRGICACEFLRTSPVNLKMLLGERPDGFTLDRRNINGYYTCGACAECLKNGWEMNVQWATWTQQQRNKRNNRKITIGGVTKTAPEWAETCGMKQSTIYSRLYRGKTGQALIAPSF